MKKFLLAIAMVAFGFTANAQDGEFNAGVNFGLPVGDVSDAYTFTASAELNYLFSVSDDFKVGPSVSYFMYFGDEIAGIEIDNASFMPLAAAGRFSVSDEFTLGADLGYALGLSPDGNDGGFYYRPMLGYSVSEGVMIQASYSGVSMDGGSFSNIGLGVMFGL